MSADVLRAAAEAIRTDTDIDEQLGRIDDRTYQAWSAVADWLDFLAPFADLPSPAFVVEHGMKVAHAYLGTTP